jgi:uncharacterized membrane protein YhfC
MSPPAFQPLILPQAFLVTIAVAAFLNLVWPAAFGLWARRRFDLRWKGVGLGALGFVLSQVVHIPLILLAKHLWLDGRMTALIVFASVTAGLCEETARWLILRRWVERSFRSGLGYGIGHGVIEAILIAGLGGLVALVQTVALAKLDPSTLPLSPDNLEAVRQAQGQIAQMVQAGWAVPLASVWERLWAVALQLGLSLCILRAVVRRQPGYWLLAVAAHSAVNVVGVLAFQRFGTLAAQAVITLFGLLALLFVVYEGRRARAAAPPAVT